MSNIRDSSLIDLAVSDITEQFLSGEVVPNMLGVDKSSSEIQRILARVTNPIRANNGQFGAAYLLSWKG